MLGGVSAKYTLAKKANYSSTAYVNGNQNYRPVMYSELLPSATTETVDANLSDVTGYSSEVGIKGHFIKRNVLIFYDLNAFYIRYNNKVGTLQVNGNPYKTNLGDFLNFKGINTIYFIYFKNMFFRSLIPIRKLLGSKLSHEKSLAIFARLFCFRVQY